MGPVGNHKIEALASGLYFVATPIGTARDITLRALDVLASADVLAAEDTRTLRHLMDIHGIPLGDRPLVAYHDHNGPQARPRLMQALAEGKTVAYASEAGTPLVADPGFQLSKDAIAAGYPVHAAPGASAILTALTIAGLPTDKFLFAGFLPNTKSQRRSALVELGQVPATLVLYESPKRVAAMINDAVEVLGGDREVAICRELTKKFEEVLRGNLSEINAQLSERQLKGEIVVLIGRQIASAVNEESIEQQLKDALSRMSVKDASDAVAQANAMPRRKVYQLALKLGKDDG
ncbi:16S rRNA (cytidine(1402)-2'-O)-methyltransferase [Donghicola sp. C2-DW-16]|uniref:Ribosomal RNA small subunit methyltransferase I n=1 Tax=Donghicola mangrovi TaxID=2729614 RepID=A0ABX2PAY7_9RHOB|nr:16S rRNA (cytidine(1402)-2'-O)-methyltransferase [Donghicola mangrovi]NVO26623.1 16S rRNA (cytidine(1402)-2'-O)-methyltransferase [Donghicola mangrovi]